MHSVIQSSSPEQCRRGRAGPRDSGHSESWLRWPDCDAGRPPRTVRAGRTTPAGRRGTIRTRFADPTPTDRRQPAWSRFGERARPVPWRRRPPDGSDRVTEPSKRPGVPRNSSRNLFLFISCVPFLVLLPITALSGIARVGRLSAESAFFRKGRNSPRWISAMNYGGLPEILVWPGPSSGFARTTSSKEESHAGDRSRYWAAERETIDGGGSCHA